MEKLRICREKDDQLDNQSLRYEERLVELHSVIAELSRQLEQRAREMIAEEECDGDVEDDIDTSCENNSETCRVQQGSEISCNSTIVAGKTFEANQTSNKSDVLSRTSTDVIDAEAVEVSLFFVGYLMIRHMN